MAGLVDGKVALVSGAGSGIGRATALALARDGAKVAVADVVDTAGQETVRMIQEAGGTALYVHLDVTNEEQWKQAVQEVVREFGKLDVLVNNAGIARVENVENESLEGFNKLIAVNETGVFLGMKTAIPEMRRVGSGSIINISSIYGTVGGSGDSVAYHAAKGAVRLMTKNAAIRLAKQNIRVNSIHPGFIETPMVQSVTSDPAAAQMHQFILNMTPMGRLGKPEEVANAIVFLASDRASYMTGSEVYVDGGWTAW